MTIVLAVYKIHATDNVATALTPLKRGDVAQIRGAAEGTVMTQEDIHAGHKLALAPIAAGAPVVKYGISIGVATQHINEGEWVHLHAMRSNYDQRSSHLNIVTGAPEDSNYE